jgi:hypothetical protein
MLNLALKTKTKIAGVTRLGYSGTHAFSVKGTLLKL